MTAVDDEAANKAAEELMAQTDRSLKEIAQHGDRTDARLDEIDALLADMHG